MVFDAEAHVPDTRRIEQKILLEDAPISPSELKTFMLAYFDFRHWCIKCKSANVIRKPKNVITSLNRAEAKFTYNLGLCDSCHWLVRKYLLHASS
jgi:hypothetical protein